MNVIKYTINIKLTFTSMTTKTDRWPGNEFKPDASIIVTYQEKKNKSIKKMSA